MNIAQPFSTALITVAQARQLAKKPLRGFEATDGDLLLCHVLDCDIHFLLVHADVKLTGTQHQQFLKLIEARRTGHPVAYLTGTRGFWSLNLQVTPATLIPRPDTECLVALALSKLKAGDIVVDIGTGSGAIALALAAERSDIQVIATDISGEAIAIAKQNALAHKLQSVTFRQCSWLSEFENRSLNMVVSNPPYIAQADPHLNQGDLRFEPITALASGCDGLDAIRILIQDAPRVLISGGWLLLEHGYQQSQAVQVLLKQAGFMAISTHQDLGQNDRVVMGQWP